VCFNRFFDVNGVYSDGCECLEVSLPTSCGAPTNLGTLGVGDVPRTMTGNLPVNGEENWFEVVFAGNTNTAYHPTIALTSNPGNAYQFDVYSDCAFRSLSCQVQNPGDVGNSTGLTTWETFYPPSNPPYNTNDPRGGVFTPIPPVGNNGTVLIRVFRVGAPTCATYTLSISNP
jgi:hypothetical protein